MFSLSNRQASKPDDEIDAGAQEPLLNDRSRGNDVIFSVEDDQDGVEHEDTRESGEVQGRSDRPRSVRFQEDVRIIGPPLRSTIHSREAGA